MASITTPEKTIAVTIRRIRVETHNALKLRAAANGRSAEAEIRAILDEAVRPAERMKVGSEIRKLVQKYGGFDLEIERDKTPARFVDFSGPEFDDPKFDRPDSGRPESE